MDLRLAGFRTPQVVAFAQKEFLGPEESLGVRGITLYAEALRRKNPPRNDRSHAKAAVTSRRAFCLKGAVAPPRRPRLPNGSMAPPMWVPSAASRAPPRRLPMGAHATGPRRVLPCSATTASSVGRGRPAPLKQRSLGVVPHAHGMLHPSPAVGVQVFWSTNRPRPPTDAACNYFVVASVSLEDALEYNMRKPTLDTLRCPKHCRQVVDTPGEDFIQHSTLGQHRDHAAKANPSRWVNRSARQVRWTSLDETSNGVISSWTSAPVPAMVLASKYAMLMGWRPP